MTNSIVKFVLLAIFITLAHQRSVEKVPINENIKRNGCPIRNESVSSTKIDAFYINLDRSLDRRKYMENQLKFYGMDHTNRIRAVTVKDVIVPHELSVAKECLSVSNLTIGFLTSSKVFNSDLSSNIETNLLPKLNVTDISPYKIVVTELCGRPKNTRRELIVTLSHLQAIKTAIYSKSTSNYALILEDDTNIAFDTDFLAMAETAPKGFGVLQLVTSNDHDVRSLINDYESNRRYVIFSNNFL